MLAHHVEEKWGSPSLQPKTDSEDVPLGRGTNSAGPTTWLHFHPENGFRVDGTRLGPSVPLVLSTYESDFWKGGVSGLISSPAKARAGGDPAHLGSHSWGIQI